MGFLSSGILIYESYGDFKDSPILVSITTKPIKYLDFPTVTVCPPKGSTTALNYDLMKARNFSFSEKEREVLKEAAKAIFDPLSLHLEYISLLEASTNERNIANVYHLQQSFPKPCGKNCLEIMLWSPEGEIESPWYDEDRSSYENQNMEERELRITLGPPKNISNGLARWTLVIDLEVNLPTDEDSMKQVEFREGPEYRLVTQGRNWSDAETFCKASGGHLASVGSSAEYQQMFDTIGDYHVWLGGTSMNTSGIWQWSDGKEWAFTKWGPGRPRLQEKRCLLGGPEGWYDLHCGQEFSFLCHINPTSVSGRRNLTKRYERNPQSKRLFQLWYRYNVSRKDPLSSKEDQRMVPFRLSWKIEKPLYKLEVTKNELGESVFMPGWGKPFNESWYQADYVFRANLVLPDDIGDRVGNGSLVIQLEVNTRQDKGWMENVRYWWGQEFFVHHKMKNWWDARDYCNNMDTDLASVHSEEMFQSLVAMVDEDTTMPVWFGGVREEGDRTWRWVDGTPWNFTQWKNPPKIREGGTNESNYLMIVGGEWWALENYRDFHFICAAEVTEVTGQKNLSWNYRKDNLAFASFQLEYRIEAVSGVLLNSREGERMTGFNLTWFIRDSNRTQLTREPKNKDGLSWDVRNEKIGGEYHEMMRKTIQLAKDMRFFNVSQDKMVEWVITNKIITTDFLRTPESLCSENQFISEHEESLFGQLSNLTTFDVDAMRRETNMTVIGDEDDLTNLTSSNKENSLEDMKNGFKVFTALVFCPDSAHLEKLKPYKFIFDLLTTQSLPTIIRTIVTAIERDANNAEFNKFYEELDQMLELQYQHVRSVYSSPAHLEDVLNKGRSHLQGKTCRDGKCTNNVGKMEGEWN